MFGVACRVGDVLVALVVVALFATGGLVADVDTCAGSEDGLDVVGVEVVLLLEGSAVDGSSSSELLSPLELLSPPEPLPPLESLLPEPSSVATAFETQEFDKSGAFIRSFTSPAQKAWIECSGLPTRHCFFKQHIPASLGLI